MPESLPAHTAENTTTPWQEIMSTKGVKAPVPQQDRDKYQEEEIKKPVDIRESDLYPFDHG